MAFARSRAGRPVVGDCGAHHEHVGPGQGGEHRPKHLIGGRCLRYRDARRQRHGQFTGDKTHLGAGVNKGAGDFDAHPAGRTVYDDPHAVKRLFGAAAVTTTRVPVNSGALPMGRGERIAREALFEYDLGLRHSARTGRAPGKLPSPEKNLYPAADNCLILAATAGSLPHVCVHGWREDDPPSCTVFGTASSRVESRSVGDAGGELADDVSGRGRHTTRSAEVARSTCSTGPEV